MKTLTKEMQLAITPEKALELLIAGNERFIENLRYNRNLLEQAQQTAAGQYPFAVILSCIDSRTSVEFVFDQGLGDVFNIRIAGAIVNEDILGSIEFACKVAGSKIIVVLGHTQCGAVKGACDHVKMGHLTTVLEKIEPAVTAEKTVAEDRCSSNPEFVDKVTDIHVKRTVHAIMNRSSILKEMIKEGQCGLIGGSHDISTGQVRFFSDTRHGFFDKKSDKAITHEEPPVLRAKL